MTLYEGLMRFHVEFLNKKRAKETGDAAACTID